MLRYVFPVCLWLIAIAKAESEWASEYPYRLAAPEMLNYSIAKVFYKEIKDQSRHRLNVRVQTQQFHGNTIETVCTLTLSARPDTVAMNISAFRRVSDHSVLIAWYDEKPYGRDRYTTVTLVSIKNNCSTMLALYVKGNPIVVPSDDSLDMFHNEPCQLLKGDSPQCKYSYPLKPQLGNPRQSAFKVDFDWSSIRIERRTKAPKDFVVRGFQGDNYKVMRMSHSTGELRELMSLPNPDRQLEMISTDLTFCWIDNPGHDTAVNCDQFNEENKSVYNLTYTFDQPMTLMTIGSDYEGMMGFVTAKVNCSDRKDCWRLRQTTLFKSGKGYRSDTSIVGCQGMNRKAWLPFKYNATLRNWRSLCIPSGDILPNNSECHRDANGRVYCITSCTRL